MINNSSGAPVEGPKNTRPNSTRLNSTCGIMRTVALLLVAIAASCSALPSDSPCLGSMSQSSFREYNPARMSQWVFEVFNYQSVSHGCASSTNATLTCLGDMLNAEIKSQGFRQIDDDCAPCFMRGAACKYDGPCKEHCCTPPSDPANFACDEYVNRTKHGKWDSLDCAQCSRGHCEPAFIQCGGCQDKNLSPCTIDQV